MVTPNPVGQANADEVLAQWEGPAIHEPGVLFEDREAEQLAMGSDIGELAAWLAVTALSRSFGDAAHASLRARVYGVLSAWRRRCGEATMDEVKQRLLARLEQYRSNRRIEEEVLRERVERLFAEIRE